MIIIKLAADIFLTFAWLTVCGLGIALRDIMLTIISTVLAIVFIYLLSLDIVRLEATLPKYIISFGYGDYFDGKAGRTHLSNAKIYRSVRSATRALNKLVMTHSMTSIPIIKQVVYKAQ